MRTNRPTLSLLFALTLALASLDFGCSKNSEDLAEGAKTGEKSAGKSGGDAAHGKQIFETTCATCHGADGTGVKGLGKPLVASEFVKKTSEANLAKMVIEGRPVDDPLNTTKVAMPPRGGNAGLSDGDIADAVAYVKTTLAK
jgi:disulfide bond formation protein DsbB